MMQRTEATCQVLTIGFVVLAVGGLSLQWLSVAGPEWVLCAAAPGKVNPVTGGLMLLLVICVLTCVVCGLVEIWWRNYPED